MIESELVLLGLLRESPKHGYDIKLNIKEIVSLFAGVDLKSIYYPLKILEKRGLVIKHSGKSGKRPERFVYSLTVKGRERFDKLLNKSFLNFKRPQFTLDLSLYFLNFIKPKIAKRRLRVRLVVLNKLAKSLKQMADSLKKKSPSSKAFILEHDLQMLETESKFLTSLIKPL